MQPVKEKKSNFCFFKSKKTEIKESTKLSSTNSIGRTAKPVNSEMDIKAQDVKHIASTSFSPVPQSPRKLPTPPLKKTQIKVENNPPLTLKINGQKYTFDVMSVEETKEHEKFVADLCVNLDELAAIRKSKAQHIARKQELEIHLIEELNNQEIRLLNKIEFYETALKDLPINWDKTGEGEQGFRVISNAIITAIKLINDYRRDFKGMGWHIDMDAREAKLLEAMENADGLIRLINHWKIYGQ